MSFRSRRIRAPSLPLTAAAIPRCLGPAPRDVLPGPPGAPADRRRAAAAAGSLSPTNSAGRSSVIARRDHRELRGGDSAGDTRRASRPRSDPRPERPPRKRSDSLSCRRQPVADRRQSSEPQAARHKRQLSPRQPRPCAKSRNPSGRESRSMAEPRPCRTLTGKHRRRRWKHDSWGLPKASACCRNGRPL